MGSEMCIRDRFWGAPYKTPYTVPQSTVSFNFTKEVHQTVQKWPECFGVWETVTEFVQEEDEDTLGAIAEAGKNNLPVFGCAPMASGKKLNAYLCSGVRLDHESYDHVEVVEKMRKGMHMLIRESCVTHFLAENMRAVTEVNPYLARRVSFCTDDVTATDILEKGHMDNLVRLAIKAGVEPMTAIQMATINKLYKPVGDRLPDYRRRLPDTPLWKKQLVQTGRKYAGGCGRPVGEGIGLLPELKI